MSKFTATLLIAILSSVSYANTTVKECAAALAVARTGSVTLTQVEPTDVRGLPGAAIAQIVKSLKDSWIQISTHEAIPSFGNPEGVNHYLLKVVGTGQRFSFGQPMMTLIGAVGESSLPANFKNEITTRLKNGNTEKNYVTTEIFLSDITSVQLVDVPEITVSLFNQVRLDGKTVTPRRFDEKIVGLTAGDSEATTILAKLSDATYPKTINGKPGEFEVFVNVLDQQNIRGRDLVIAYRNFADGNIEDLITGVLERPAEVAKAINKALGLEPAMGPKENYKNLN